MFLAIPPTVLTFLSLSPSQCYYFCRPFQHLFINLCPRCFLIQSVCSFSQLLSSHLLHLKTISSSGSGRTCSGPMASLFPSAILYYKPFWKVKNAATGLACTTGRIYRQELRSGCGHCRPCLQTLSVQPQPRRWKHFRVSFPEVGDSTGTLMHWGVEYRTRNR